jgi:LGFP repeat
MTTRTFHDRIRLPASMAARDAIAATYNELGGAGGFLGAASGVLNSYSDNVGFGQEYAGGIIVWTSGTGAHEVHGDIRLAWQRLGTASGLLGYPLGNETGTPDGMGRYNHFQGGSIYWTPTTGAHEVHGDIRRRWADLGWETSFVGYPITDETGVLNGPGRYNDFQQGSIYWNPTIGARDSAGLVPGGLDFDSGPISFATGIAAGGHTEVTLSPDGSAHFRGTMHDSGAVAYNYNVAFVVVDADDRAYTFTRSGNVAGTFESGSRDDPWDVPGQDARIAQNWRSLAAGARWHCDSSISGDVQALLGSVLTTIGTVAAVIAICV